MPFPPPSQDVDFNAFIYTSTPFYATAADRALTQLPPLTPDFSAHSEIEASMSPPPLFIGSSDDGIMEMPPNVVSSQEKVEEGGLRVEVESALPTLPKQDVSVEKTRLLAEIPDSEAESETSSPLNEGSVVGEEQNGEVGIACQMEEVVQEHGSVVDQGREGVEDENIDPMNDVERNAVSFAGVDGDLGFGRLDTSSTHENGKSVTAHPSTVNLIQNGEEKMINNDHNSDQTTAMFKPHHVGVENRMEFNPLVGVVIQSRSYAELNPLHMANSHMEQEYHGQLPLTTALRQARSDVLDETHRAQDIDENVAFDESEKLVDLDFEPARLHDITDTQTIENTPSLPHSEVDLDQRESEYGVPLSSGEHREDLIKSFKENHSETRLGANATKEMHTQEHIDDESCTSPLDNEISKLLSTEADGSQAGEHIPVEDEISLIPTGSSSQVADIAAEVRVEHGETEDVVMQDEVDMDHAKASLLLQNATTEASVSDKVEDVIMEDVVQQGKLDIDDSEAIEESVPRPTRRKSSRKSDKVSTALPKQTRRKSVKGRPSMDSEATEPQPIVENSDIDSNNNFDPDKESTAVITTDDVISEKKLTRKASSTRRKSQLQAKGGEVPPPDTVTTTIHDDTQKSRDQNLAPDSAVESQVSKQSPKRTASRRKSQRAIRTEEDVPVRADVPAPVEGHDEVDEKDTIMAPAPEPPVETSPRKRSQRKVSSTSKKASGRAAKRDREDEFEEQREAIDEPIPEVSKLESQESDKPAVPQRPLAPTREGSQSKDVLIAELKAMKIASIQARNASLEAEIAAKRAKVEEITKELAQPATDTVKRHIKLLHDYNDIRDVGQALVGMIADNRGVRISELYDEFGVGLKD